MFGTGRERLLVGGATRAADAPGLLDGRRVYVTNSLCSTWDNQAYPGLEGWLAKLDRRVDGTDALDPNFFVDFSELDTRPARPHEIHLPGGDCTTEIFP